MLLRWRPTVPSPICRRRPMFRSERPEAARVLRSVERTEGGVCSQSLSAARVAHQRTVDELAALPEDPTDEVMVLTRAREEIRPRFGRLAPDLPPPFCHRKRSAMSEAEVGGGSGDHLDHAYDLRYEVKGFVIGRFSGF